jgi:hypothetical protein
MNRMSFQALVQLGTVGIFLRYFLSNIQVEVEQGIDERFFANILMICTAK